MLPCVDIFLQQASSDVGFEPIHHPCIGKALDTLWQGAIQNYFKVVLVISRWHELSLVLAWIDKSPWVIVETGLFGGLS